MMQVYVSESGEAAALCQTAFDSPLISSYPNADGTYHAELDIEGEFLEVEERNPAYAIGYRQCDAVLPTLW